MPNLWQSRLNIEKFVYQKGTNVALYNAEHSERYQDFKSDVAASLKKQVKYIYNDQNKLDTLLLFVKAANQDLINQVAIMLESVSLGDDVDLAGFLVWAGTQGGQASLDKNGIKGVFGLKNQELVDYFDDYSNLIIDSVDLTTKEWIADVIQRGKDELLNPFEIADLLRTEADIMSKDRAETIVLTETARAMTVVENEVSKRLGIKEKIWRTSLDERVCPICSELDGDKVPIDGLFQGEFEGPPAHPRCRCYREDVPPPAWVPPTDPWLGA